jgi:hypothetical protein
MPCLKIRRIKAEAVSTGVDLGSIGDILNVVTKVLGIVAGATGSAFLGSISEASSKIKDAAIPQITNFLEAIGRQYPDQLYLTETRGLDDNWIWPHDEPGYYEIENGGTVSVNLKLPFDSQISIKLWDEDRGEDDCLGELVIDAAEKDTKLRVKPVVSEQEKSFYLVEYQVYPHTCPIDTWKRIDGLARDIGIGGDRSVWVLGYHPNNEGNSLVYRRSGNTWEAMNGYGIGIDVAPGGTPWVFNRQGELFYLDLNTHLWKRVPGQVRGVGIGGDRSVWVVGWDFNAQEAGYSIYRRNGENWEFTNGYGVAVDVAPGGTPWIVNQRGEIFIGE